jgi:hypothetical protein
MCLVTARTTSIPVPPKTDRRSRFSSYAGLSNLDWIGLEWNRGLNIYRILTN